MRNLLTALAALLSFPAFGQVPGVTAKSILLGQSAAFSGPAAQLGIQMNIGTKAYLDHINARGGVYGRKIALKTRDDRYEANLCADATTKLIEEDKVFALISYVGTPTTAAAMPIITNAKVPLVGPFTGAELLRTPVNRYIFNVRASYYDETEKIVDLLVSNGNRSEEHTSELQSHSDLVCRLLLEKKKKKKKKKEYKYRQHRQEDYQQ